LWPISKRFPEGEVATMPDSEETNQSSRRDFLIGGAAVTGLALAPSIIPVADAQSSAGAKRPNLLFIYVEGQRADALGLAGNTLLKTPNMDRIGREGAWFKNSFCTNALCAPARATALTGLYSNKTGAVDNSYPDVPLPENIPLFTDLLQQAGYEVGIVGKVHVRNGVKERYWDYYFGFNAAYTNYYSPKFAEGRAGKIGPEVTYSGYADDVATDHALAWLNEKRDKQFCLLLWFQTPHGPFYRARRHLDLYNGVSIPKPSTFDEDLKGYPGKPAFQEANIKIGTIEDANAARSVEELVKDYYAGLVAVDENIGRVVKCLETQDKLEDTAILHSSDHGFFLGEWRLFDKRFMHEPSIRVPTMLRYPQKVRPGTVVDEMVIDVDFAPTLLNLAGVPIPAHMQGKSLLNLTARTRSEWRKDWFYHYYEYPYPHVQPHRGIRTPHYKLIHYYRIDRYELYNLQNDPGELHNLAGLSEYSEIQAALWKRLGTMRIELGEQAPLNSNSG
jgi:arylsulfatase A-like enzyme